MEKISDILLKYKTDKNHGCLPNIYKDLDNWEIVENPDDRLGHTYGIVYDEVFDKFDVNDNLNILEIGIQKGGSLCAWKDYFKNSNIYGVDIIDCIKNEYRRNEFTYIFSDIKESSVAEKLKDTNFDIIIDDGSHFLEDVIFVVSNYLQKLKRGGYLIIEDCQHPEYWLTMIKSCISNDYEIITRDLRRVDDKYLYDNYIILIKRL